MTGLVTAIYDIGCALGAVVAFVFGERIGRKRSIILANLIVIVGAAIQTASFDYWQMFVARIIGGVGVGLSTVAVPILQSETLPAHNRGALLVSNMSLAADLELMCLGCAICIDHHRCRRCFMVVLCDFVCR
jgi:MFS family permease